MKKFALILCLLAGSASAEVVPKVCTKCNKVNEWHKEHPNPYVYYEDYLEHKDELDDNPFVEETFDLPDDE